MGRRTFNRSQRIVVVVGLGVGLLLFGEWLTTRYERTGWVAYAPLSNTINGDGVPGGFHPWVRLVIWLILVLVWVALSAFLLRTPEE